MSDPGSPDNIREPEQWRSFAAPPEPKPVKGYMTGPSMVCPLCGKTTQESTYTSYHVPRFHAAANEMLIKGRKMRPRNWWKDPKWIAVAKRAEGKNAEPAEPKAPPPKAKNTDADALVDSVLELVYGKTSMPIVDRRAVTAYAEATRAFLEAIQR